MTLGLLVDSLLKLHLVLHFLLLVCENRVLAKLLVLGLCSHAWPNLDAVLLEMLGRRSLHGVDVGLGSAGCTVLTRYQLVLFVRNLDPNLVF